MYRRKRFSTHMSMPCASAWFMSSLLLG
jgi:hypothetical protein